MKEQIVIVGAGHAAGQVVATLKQKKFAGRIVLIGDEPFLPYQRPPLSKKYLAGELPAERLHVKPESFYADEQIELKLGTRVAAIDTQAATVTTADGDAVRYDKLILATGSRVRRLEIPGADLAGIHYVRSIADVEAMQSAFVPGARAVIIGAGYIGLEVAAVARQLGLEVSVVETAPRVMSRVVCPEVSAFYERQHAAHGVELLLNTGTESFTGDDQVDGVKLADGRRLDADVVVVGVGILPNTELAEAAGLETANGIVVDDHCRTSAADVFAVGDCTCHPNAIYNRNVRLESVHNALEQAKTAAANACGDDVAYSQVPWFWSDQYDIKLQIAGLSQGYDDVLTRGDPEEASFSCVYLKEGRVIAVDAVNAPKDFMQSKALIASRATPDRERLQSEALKELA
ncbi:MAG: FAD-dependent oxidoreductase [Woeseiaceae bacterium]|nr:FAD-dependent oxidoreductase [Woeseiaceae bacterium]